MPNIKSAEKRVRVEAKSRLRNREVKSELKTLARKFKEAVSSGDKGAAEAAYKEYTSSLDKAAVKGTIHKNNSSRKKAQISSALAKMSS